MNLIALENTFMSIENLGDSHKLSSFGNSSNIQFTYSCIFLFMCEYMVYVYVSTLRGLIFAEIFL